MDSLFFFLFPLWFSCKGGSYVGDVGALFLNQMIVEASILR